MKYFAPAALILVSGCMPLSTDPGDMDCGPSPTIEEINTGIQAWCDMFLLDPSSAQIRNINTVAKRKWQNLRNPPIAGWEVTFEVNAKNRMGGYAGFQRREILMRNGQAIWRQFQPGL